MAKAASSYGLKRISGDSSDHAVVLLHGIRQTREDIERPFGASFATHAGATSVYVYGYNHTRGLVDNGRLLADILEKEITAKRIDLVGYSMGGLVARLAVSDRALPGIRTVVTLATPNRGSLSNAELATLGQLGRSLFSLISPLAPRTEGVKDLTRAQQIMSTRREAILSATGPVTPAAMAAKRYASIPGLFYNDTKTDFEWGPSVALSAVQATFLLPLMKRRLVNMKKPHDGIVTESSNDLSQSTSYDFSEIHLAAAGPNGEPPLCHAFVDSCKDRDHGSILEDQRVARLAWNLIACSDWRQIETYDPALLLRVRARFGSASTHPSE
jgi:pimeloyl-ACP methyl ester carboxylesterase